MSSSEWRCSSKKKREKGRLVIRGSLSSSTDRADGMKDVPFKATGCLILAIGSENFLWDVELESVQMFRFDAC